MEGYIAPPPPPPPALIPQYPPLAIPQFHPGPIRQYPPPPPPPEPILQYPPPPPLDPIFQYPPPPETILQFPPGPIPENPPGLPAPINPESSLSSQVYCRAKTAIVAIAGGIIAVVMEKLAMYFLARLNKPPASQPAATLETDLELTMSAPV